MKQEELKKIGLTSIEDMITEDFGEVGTPEREAFELSCDTFIHEEKQKQEHLHTDITK